VIGKWIKKRSGAVYKVLVQDLMAAAATQSSIRGGGLVSGIVERIEGSGLRAADSVAVITDSFKKRVLAYGVNDDKIVLSPNYSHSNIQPLDRDECRRELGWSHDDLLVIHTGNMGLKQDLGNVIEAARLLAQDRPDIKFYLVGDGSQRAALENQARGMSNVKFFDLFSKELYPKVLGAANVLLINESPDQVDMSLPSKLTSYLAANKRIVAATVKGGATHSAIKSTQGSTTIEAGNSDLLADAICAPNSQFKNHQHIESDPLEQRIQWVFKPIAPSYIFIT
jgi:colanic acid biosynthesis glycosyl transferase WcaI